MLAGDINHGTGLDIDSLGVGLILDLRPGFQLGAGKYAKVLKKLHRLLFGQNRDRVHHGLDIGKAAALRLLDPLIRVAVSIEDDALMLGSVFFDQIVNRHVEVFRLLQYVAGLGEGLRHNRIEHHIGLRHRIAGADHTELELVAGEGEGRGAVPVRGVLGEIRQGAHAGVQMAALQAVGRLAGADKLRQYILQLLAQVDGNDGGRRLVGSQTVVISHVGRRFPQQGRVAVHCLQHTGQHQKELYVLMGRLARIEKVDAVVSGQGPVVVLSGAVHSREGLLVEQALEAVLVSHLFQGLHNQLVVVHRHVAFRVDGSQLMLSGSHLVVLGLGRYAQLPQLLVHIIHKVRDPLPDHAEIVIVQLLALGRHGAKEGPAGKNQILALQIFLPIHQEILLLRAHGGGHPVGGRVPEQAQQAQSLLIDRLHGTQKRRLLIQSLALVRAEGRRDIEDRPGAVRALLYKGRRGAVPGRIASGLKGGAQSSGGEGGSVRLALYQLFSGKLHQYLAVRLGRGQKGVVLLCRRPGQRLEPVGIMSRPLLQRPLLHLVGHHIRHSQVEFLALADGPLQLLVNLLRKPLFHHCVVKYVFSENLGNHRRLFFHSSFSPFFFSTLLYFACFLYSLCYLCFLYSLWFLYFPHQLPPPAPAAGSPEPPEQSVSWPPWDC